MRTLARFMDLCDRFYGLIATLLIVVVCSISRVTLAKEAPAKTVSAVPNRSIRTPPSSSAAAKNATNPTGFAMAPQNCPDRPPNVQAQTQNLNETVCRAELIELKCDQFFESQSERENFERKCPEEKEESFSAGHLGLTCLKQIVAPAADSLKGVFAFIAIGIKETAQRRKEFSELCSSSSQLKLAIAKSIPIFSNSTNAEVARMPCEALLVEFEENEARQKEYHANENAEAIYQKYVSSNQRYLSSETARNPFLDFIQRNKEKWRCLNKAGHVEMTCYGFFSIVDPTMLIGGAGAAIKGLRLARLFEKATASSEAVSNIAVATVKSSSIAANADRLPEFPNANNVTQAGAQVSQKSAETAKPPMSAFATKVERRMVDFQGLRSTLVEFVDDPAIPEHLKALVRKALAGDDVDIVKLTDDLRKEYLIPENFNALAATKQANFQLITRADHKSVNQVATDLANGKTSDARKVYPFKADNTVMVQDRALDAKNNDLTLLVHELAHIRLQRFMEANIDKLSERLPRDLIRKTSEGKFEIDEQLFHYLNERFAHEMELKAVKSTARIPSRYSGGWVPEKWRGAPVLAMTEQETRRLISDHVARAYGITDPRILALREKKLSEILIGGRIP